MKNLWCDSIVCEKNIAWMVGTNVNALFKLDFNMRTYEFITDFPDEPIIDFRVNPFYIKIENEIFFFPDLGKYIWIYNVTSKSFDKISLNNPNKARIGINMIFKVDNSIYAIANGLKQIVEINISKKSVVGIYSIEKNMQGFVCNSEGCIANANIYFTIPEKNEICEFSTETKNITTYSVDGEIMPQTICYDGKDFWLTGRTKEIVRWNKEKNAVIDYLSIPKSVGVFESVSGIFCENTSDVRYQKPLYRWSLNFLDKIWFIPYMANKVVYFDKKEQKICICNIESEHEDAKSWDRLEQVKYRFECIFQERYILLYSFKNRQYLIIDTTKNTAQPMNIVMRKESFPRFFEHVLSQHSYMVETDNMNILDIFDLPSKNGKEKKSMGIGKKIYQQLMMER